MGDFSRASGEPFAGNGMDDFLAHAIIEPTSSAGHDPTEVRCAKALSLEILGPLGEGPLARTWRARTVDGLQVGLVVIADAATESDRERFASSADKRRAAGPIQGTVQVHSVAPSRDAFVTDLWTMGCATDLPALNWPPRRRLQFVRRVAQSLDALHRAGIVHGCLCGDNVLLDDDLQPVLAEAGMVSLHGVLAPQADSSAYGAFAAPEVKRGEEPDVRSDIWSAGQLLGRLVAETEVPQASELTRRCAALLSQMRYPTAEELVAAIDGVLAALPAGDVASRPNSPLPPTQSRERRTPAVPNSRAVTVPSARTARTFPLPTMAGAALIALSAAAAFLVGARTETGRDVLAGMFGVGAALATWVIPKLESVRVAVRVALAGACGILVMLVHPLSWSLHAGAQWRLHGDEGARRVAVADIMDTGRDFRGMKLSGMDFSGFDLTGADFRGADLSHADLSGSCLWLAEIKGASLEGAQLSRANLEETELGDALHVESARCDAATRLPEGWQCDQGKPSHR